VAVRPPQADRRRAGRRRHPGVGLTAVRACLGLGANEGDRAGAIATAIQALGDADRVTLLAASTPREYAAEGGPDGQPAYLNAAAVVETDLPPHALWGLCRTLERAAGRRRVTDWGPRPLDCDLLLYGAARIDDAALTVPHPRMAGRGFVLEPLTEVAPGAEHPRWNCTVRELRDRWRARRERARGAPVHCDGTPAYDAWRRGGHGTVGFVPTMGALHDGHRSLMRAARQECDRVVVSIYVNPLQFGAGEDLDAYPRDLAGDLALCATEGVDAVVTFQTGAMYPAGHVTRVEVAGVTEPLEGAHRPGHFTGVTTVVAKLFNIVRPDVAYFGQKDAQQCAVIRRMTADLNLPVALAVLPTVREADGLAQSSRNAYLSEEERAAAPAIAAALRATAERAADGTRDGAALRAGLRTALEHTGGIALEYAEVVDPATFAPADRIGLAALAVVAARVGPARLIDNMWLHPPFDPAEVPNAP
jgi:pantoate--beta-alanine ligase